DQPAQAVADHDRVGLAQRPDQTSRVRGRRDQVVAAGWLVAAAVAAQVHRDPGNPCRSSTSGPSPASAAWKRVPLAEIDLCAQGPPIWTTASAPPAMTVTSPGLARGDLGLLAVAAEYPETLGHGLARLLQSGQPPQLQV